MHSHVISVTLSSVQMVACAHACNCGVPQSKDVRNSVDLQRAASDVSAAASDKSDSRGGGGGSEKARTPLRRPGSMPLSGGLMPAVPFALKGLELGPIVGKGSYGSVYRGSYQKQHVAVKVRSLLS